MNIPKSALGVNDLSEWWGGLVEVYRAEAESAGDPSSAAVHHMECARILHEELGLHKEATAEYMAAWARQPSGLEVPRCLLGLARECADWRSAAKWLTLLIAESNVPGEKASFRLDLARLKTKHLGDKAGAVSICGAILDEEPGHPEALELFDELCRNDPKNELRVLERRLAAATDPSEVERLLLRIAGILENQDISAAKSAYTRILTINSQSIPASLGMYRLLSREGDTGELRAFLSRSELQRASGLDWVRRDILSQDSQGEDEWAYLYGAPVRYEDFGNHDGAPQDFAWASAAYRRGLTFEAEGDSASAEACYRAADPQGALFLGPLLALRRISLKTADNNTLQQSGRDLRDRAMTPGYKAWLSTHIGISLLHRFGLSHQALAWFEDALHIQLSAVRGSGFVGAAGLEPYVRLMVQEVEAPRAIQTLKKLADDLSIDAVPWLLYDAIAELYEGDLEVPDEALRYYELALDKNGFNAHAHRYRQFFYRVRKEDTRLFNALENEMSWSNGYRRLRVLDELAEVQLALGSSAGAEAAWREALEEEPSWYPASMGLGQLLDQQGRWRELAEHIEDELASMPAGSTGRIGLLGRLAEIYEFMLDMPERAELVFQELMREKPGAPDAIAGLERIYERLGQWEAMAGLLRRHLEHLERPLARANCLVKLGDIFQHQLSNSDEAIRCYEAAQADAPGVREIEWGLEQLLIRSRQRARLRDLYRIQLNREHTQAGLRVLRYKLADVAQPDEAVRLWQLILEDAPGDLFAHWGLLRDSAERGDDSAVASQLIAIADLLTTRSDIVCLLLEAAERLPFGAGPVDEQTDLWERIAEIAPERSRVWYALLAHYFDAKDNDSLLEFLTRFEAAGGEADSRGAALWLAELIAERGGANHRRPGERYRRAAKLSPSDATPIWLLVDRGLESSTSERIEWLEFLGERSRDRVTAAQYLSLAGHLSAFEEGDTLRGLKLFQQALAKDPSHSEAADLVERILSDMGQEYALATFYRERLAEIAEPEMQIGLLLRLARVLSGSLMDLSGAQSALDEVLETEPGHIEAHRELGHIHMRQGNYQDAALHFNQLVDRSDAEEDLQRGYLSLGLLHLEHLGNARLAIDAYQLAQGVLPSSQGLLGLADAYLAGGDVDLAHLTYRRLERRIDDPEMKIISILGQVASLVAGDRQAEALRRLKALRLGSDAPPRAQGIATRLLSGHVKLNSELRSHLVRLIEFSAEAKPDASEPQVGRQFKNTPEPMARKETVATLDGSIDTSLPPSPFGGVPEDQQTESPVLSAIEPALWRTALSKETPDSARANWIQNVLNWIEGIDVIVEPGYIASLTDSDRIAALPPSIHPSLYRLLRALLGPYARPLVDEAGRAEIAAEGTPFESDEPIVTRAKAISQTLGLDEVLIVHNEVRPYTIDILRKDTSVITIGARLFDELDAAQLDFLVATSLVAVAEGSLPLRFTPAGRAMDEGALSCLLGAIFAVFGLNFEVRDREKARTETLRMELSEVARQQNYERLETWAKEAFEATRNTDLATLRLGLESYTARHALALTGSFGGAMEVLRRLNFDDRQRKDLTQKDLIMILDDDQLLADLVSFASTAGCLAVRGNAAESD